ncbi:MAG: FAH family protein, partial [Acidobacteria bacterium]|nr:FAH family protein [Acidobacteriota bacterium]
EDTMSHSIANLEHHHFKFARFRRPGDVHVHFLGAGVLSHGAGIAAEAGDVFEIDVPAFGRPLRNPLRVHAAGPPVAAHPL